MYYNITTCIIQCDDSLKLAAITLLLEDLIFCRLALASLILLCSDVGSDVGSNVVNNLVCCLTLVPSTAMDSLLVSL